MRIAVRLLVMIGLSLCGYVVVVKINVDRLYSYDISVNYSEDTIAQEPCSIAVYPRYVPQAPLFNRYDRG